MNTITIELCPEDRARLDKVIELLGRQPNCDRCVETAVRIANAPQPVTTAKTPEDVRDGVTAYEFTKDTPAEDKPAEAAQEPDMAPQVSREDIQKKVIQLSADGKKAQVREIVTAVAVKVSDIPEDKLADVWNKLTALEG